MSDAFNESLYDKSLRINGWGVPEYLATRESSELNDLTIDKQKVQANCVTDVASYLKLIMKLEQERTRPIFYRGHLDANYYNLPIVFRDNFKNEHILINEFIQRFPEECLKQENTFTRLALMQHYGLHTRLLDITEDPLAALYFACKPNVKFTKNPDESFKHWGCVVLFRNSDDEKKYYDSNTVKVIANTAFCEQEFEYGRLDIISKQDNRMEVNPHWLYFKDIVRYSVIVRPPMNSIRIKNQRGCFILCNCNRVKDMGKGSRISAEAFTKEVINGKAPHNLYILNEQKNVAIYGNFNEWDIKFEKVEPYSLNNDIKEFQDDPYDLKKLLYKDESKKQVIFLIPPQAKKDILGELEKLNITDSFIYPEMDTTANELNRLFVTKNR